MNYQSKACEILGKDIDYNIRMKKFHEKKGRVVSKNVKIICYFNNFKYGCFNSSAILYNYFNKGK